MADALRHRGLEVTLFGRSEAVLPIVDRELSRAVEDELRAHDVQVESGEEVTGIEEADGDLVVRSRRGR
jgi:NADPH-dependent 2,4-dienoyl-CoA reductase/sulfur reductase-like enzyme